MAEKEEDLLAGAVDNGHDVLSEEQLLGEEPIEIKQEVKDEMDLYDAVTEPTSDKDTSMLVQASSVPSTPVAASKPAVQTTQTHTSYGGKKYCCYIGNMTWWTTDADLQVAVANCGLTDLCDIKFHENRTNGQSKGFCLAVFYSENSVRVLTEKLPLRPVHGQTLVVLPYSKVSLSRLEDATAKTQTRVDKKDKKFEEETPNVMNMGTIRIGVNGISAVGPPAGMIGGGPGPGGPMMGPGGGGRPMGGPMGGGPGIMGPGNAMGGGGMMGPGGMRQGANPMMMMTGPPVGMRPAVSMGGPSIGMGQLPMGGGNQMQMGPRPNMSGPPPGAGMNRPGGMMTGPPPGAMSGPPPGSMSGPPPGTMAGPPIHTNVPPPVFVSSTAPPQPLLSRQVAPPPLHMGGPQQQSSSLPPPGAHVNPNVYPVFQAHEAPPPLSDAELEEVMSRNKTVASSAISRAISDATGGDHATAMETLLTAITLIKQSRASADERCKLLISSLHDTLSGIEAKMSSRKHGNSRRDRSRSRSRERKRHRRGSRSRSRSRTRSPRRKY